MRNHHNTDRKVTIWAIVLWGIIAAGVAWVLFLVIVTVAMSGMMTSYG